MIMKKFQLCLLSCLLPCLLWAGGIHGVLQDAQGPLPSADVLLFKISDTTHVFRTDMSIDDGSFSFKDVPLGRYMVKVEFMGYRTKKIGVTLSSARPEIKEMHIRMQDDTKMLKEVVITGQRSALHVDADKKTFLVNAGAVTEGVSASDILKDVPTVNVDVEGNVSLRNNENVEVYINGKPAGLNDENRGDILEQLPASSIEKVEVVTNPSSKYNAEGEAGIINIVMKEDHKKGYYGSVTTGLNYPTGGSLGGSLGASLNYTTGKWDLSGSFGVQRSTLEGERTRNRRSYAGGDTSITNSDADIERKIKSGFLRLGAVLHLDSCNSFSWNGMGSLASRDNTENYRYEYGRLLYGNERFSRYSTSDNYTDSERDVFSSSLDYTHKFRKEGEQLTASFAYSQNWGDNDADYNLADQDSLHSFVPNSSSARHEDQDRKMHNYTFQTDYVLPLGNTSKLETGTKASWQNDHNNAFNQERPAGKTEYEQRDNLSNDFELQQNIYALYASLSGQFSKRLKFNAGLRGELTDMDWTQHTTGEKSNSDPYLDLFPSAFLSYTLSKTDELQLNYTRRISRPRLSRINPYINSSDSANLSFGNPDLDPEMTHSLEFNYVKNANGDLYTASLYYKYTDGVISSYSWMDGEVMKTTYGNLSSSYSDGLELIAKNHIKFITLTSNLNFYYTKLNGGSLTINSIDHTSNLISAQTVHVSDNSSLSWTGKMNADLDLPWKLQGQISANYLSPVARTQGRSHHVFTMNAGLKRSFCDRKLTASVSVRDLFDSFRFKNSTCDSNFDQESSFYRGGRTFYLNLTYNFGNMGGSKKNSKNRKGDDGGTDIEEMDDLSASDVSSAQSAFFCSQSVSLF